MNAALPGKVVKILIKPGDVVTNDQVVAVIESMKMENEISSEESGMVKEILVSEGDIVQIGQPIIIIG